MQRISIQVVIDKLLRDPLFNNIGLEAVVDYCIEFLQIVGVPDMFIDQYTHLEISDYRCILPEDCIEINQLLVDGIPARSATDTFQIAYNELKTVDNFDTLAAKGSQIARSADITYKIQGEYAYFSTEQGQVDLSYKAISLDENGLPTLPNDEALLRALRLYIEQAWIIILWRAGKVSDKVYQDVQQRYAWAVGQCETSLRRLSLDKAESFFNMFRTLIVRDDEYVNRFRNLGAKEYIKR